MKIIGMIADHPTPKFNGGGIAFTMNSRDYKAPLVIAYTSTRFGEYKEGVGTLKASGGDIGGGQRNLDSGNNGF